MDFSFNDLKKAVHTAKMVNMAADGTAKDMAILLQGRLRNVNRHDVNRYSAGNSALRKLKRELANYNMQTGQWRD